jgi:hypothetical protein
LRRQLSRCAEPPHEPCEQSTPAARLLLFPDLGETTLQSTSTTHEHSTSPRKQLSPSHPQHTHIHSLTPTTPVQWYVHATTQDPAAGLSTVQPQDRWYRTKANSPALVNINTPSQLWSADFIFPCLLISHDHKRSAKTTASTRESHSLQTLTRHVRSTGAKHQLQGGLLPLRQARQRPCRPSRPGRSPQSMRPKSHSRGDQGP